MNTAVGQIEDTEIPAEALDRAMSLLCRCPYTATALYALREALACSSDDERGVKLLSRFAREMAEYEAGQ